MQRSETLPISMPFWIACEALEPTVGAPGPFQYIARSTTMGTPFVDSTFVENGASRSTLISPLTTVRAPPLDDTLA